MPRDQSSGFTLVELLVVLTIIGLLAAVSMPLFGRGAPGAALAAAATELRGALHAARAAAVTDGVTVAFRGDPAGGYWLGAYHYPIGAASGSQLRVRTRGAARISFFPSGGSSGGRVLVEGASGRREIAVDAVTGRAVLEP